MNITRQISKYARPFATVVALLTALLTANLTLAQEDTCRVSVETNDTVRVRVGPGENRTAITFLEADTHYTVTGFNAINDEIWYQLDSEEAAPGRPVEETWVNSIQVEIHGDCDALEESVAPIIRPIVTSSSSETTDTTSEDAQESTETDESHIVVTEGFWLVEYAAITHTSCENGENVDVSTVDWFGYQPGFVDALTLTDTGFYQGGADFIHIGDNTYHATFSDGIITGTVYLTVTSSGTMEGRYIDSFEGCSSTTNVTLTLI